MTGVEHNLERRFNFEFRENDTSTEKILLLKTFDLQNETPGRFAIREISWDHTILRAFIEVFYHFKEQQIIWEELSLDIDATDHAFTCPLLRTINDLNLFKKMDLRLFIHREQDYRSECEYLFPGIINNKLLEVLHVGIANNPVDDMLVALTPLIRETTNLKELKLKEMPNYIQGHYTDFCESLAKNVSLERLYFDFMNCDIADEGVSQVITSLIAHPKLQNLRIYTVSDFGSLSSQAIQKLLKETQTLSVLRLDNCGNSTNGNLNAEALIQGLKKNQSLKLLETSGAVDGDRKFSRFFRAFSDCPLEHLVYIEEISKSDFDRVIHMDRLSKPMTLMLKFFVTCRNYKAIGKLLHRHPEVRLVWGDTEYSIGDSDFKHICKLNWHGRYLLHRTRVPLSLWPLVFEKANNETDVMYEFLKGPAFASRAKGT